MTLEQLRAFAHSDEQHVTKLALTKEGARALIREHDHEVNAAIEDGLLFEIDTRKHNGPLDAQFTLARFRRMAAEDAALGTRGR